MLAHNLALPVNLAEHYIGFGVANRVAMDCTSDRAVRRLWYKRLDYSGGQSIWSNLVALPAYGPESIHYGTLRSACGKIPAYWIGTSTGWAHAYQEGAAIILQALHAATKSNWAIMFQAFAAGCAVLSTLLSFAFMESLCIYGFRPRCIF